MDPDNVGFVCLVPYDFRKLLIDLDIEPIIRGIEHGQINPVVHDRPEHTV